MKFLAQMLFRFGGAALLVVGGAALMWQYQSNWSKDAQHQAEIRRHQAEIRKLQEQNQVLQDFVTKLTSRRMLAEMVVVDQKRQGSAVTETTLLFVELAPDGTKLPGRYFTIRGDEPHLDSLVVKFDYGFMQKDDPLKGQSLALFYRLYGSEQPPTDGARIYDPEQVPEVFRVARTPEGFAFEQQLWRDFWKLTGYGLTDEQASKLRQERGVRLAMGQGVWSRVEPDRLYTIELERAGGMEIRSRQMDATLREALRAKAIR